MNDLNRLAPHITNTLIAINHKDNFPKISAEQIKTFRSYDSNTRFDIVAEVIRTYEGYCFELANQGIEFNIPSIGKLKIKDGTTLWKEIKQRFAIEQGFESFDDIPTSIIEEHLPALEIELKQTFFDNKLEGKAQKKLTKDKELLAKTLEGM